MPFIHQRSIYFQDTDAAGVVYFATLLSICHEAYEASLAAAGIDLRQFFRAETIAVPVVQADIQFFRPLYCGDHLAIQLHPVPLSPSEFEIHYRLWLHDRPETTVSQAQTRHVCVATAVRQRTDLPPPLQAWLARWAAPSPPQEPPG